VKRNCVLLIFGLAKRVRNSFEMELIIVLRINEVRFLYNHIGVVIKIKKITPLNQFKDVLIEVDGSKTENKLVIIISFFFWKAFY
jgi:hypothetical protein